MKGVCASQAIESSGAHENVRELILSLQKENSAIGAAKIITKDLQTLVPRSQFGK